MPPIRQTASIFKQPVTVYKTQESKVKTDLKQGTQEKPKQLFWEKRLEVKYTTFYIISIFHINIIHSRGHCEIVVIFKSISCCQSDRQNVALSSTTQHMSLIQH